MQRRTAYRKVRPVGAGRSLDPLDELDLTLSITRDIGQCIQNADTKSGMLGAVLGCTFVGVSSQPGQVHGTLSTTGAPLALFALFVVSLLAGCACVGLTQLPRLTTSRDVRHLAFPALAYGDPQALAKADPAELRDEAWRQAVTLAQIAQRKFRWLRAGLLCCGLCAVAYLGWLSVLPPAR
jgi:hypothetical protein